MNSLSFKRLSAAATLPTRGNETDIGLDLYANLGVGCRTPVYPRCKTTIPTGFATAVPLGRYGRIAPRSGLAAKHGLDVLGGVVDPGYRGELFVLLLNTTDTLYYVSHGDRVAQFILEVADTLPPIEVESLDDTCRGSLGFGSTGY